jgi:hypothetical protein
MSTLPSALRASGSSLSQRCNEFLMSSDRDGREAVRQLARAGHQDERLHTYNKAPLLNRPGLLEAGDVATIERDLSTLLDLLVTLPDRLFDGRTAQMCERVGIKGPARRAVLDTAGDTSVVIARADVVRSAQGLKAIEFNVHSSLGGMEIGPLNETFQKLPVYSDFLHAENLSFRDPLESIVSEVVHAAADRGIAGTPTVALVDWPTTYPVYERALGQVCALMRARGVDAMHTHVGRLAQRNGHLWCGDTKIDVVYRIFMLEDIPERPELITPILDAHRAGNVLLAMSFFAELVGNKAGLALLSEAREQDFLTADERATVDRILPQTRLLRDGKTSWDGESCDLIGMALAKKNDLVLKPAIGHANRGVTLGSAVTDEEWRRALRHATGDVFVLQEHVPAAPESVPILEGDDWRTRDYDVNWGVFIHQRRYAGAMLRALPSSHRNVISLGTGAEFGCCFHQNASSHGDE